MNQKDQTYVDTTVAKWIEVLARIKNNVATFEDVEYVADFVMDQFVNAGNEYSSSKAFMVADGIGAWLDVRKTEQPAAVDIAR